MEMLATRVDNSKRPRRIEHRNRTSQRSRFCAGNKLCRQCRAADSLCTAGFQPALHVDSSSWTFYAKH